MKKTTHKRISMLIVFVMILGICMPVSAKEYYNYESKYTIQLSEEAYGKISKVNANLMSIIIDDGVSMTFSVNNFFESLPEETIAESSPEDYVIGAEIFAETYNNATYMKEEFFTKKLSNVSGTTEMDTVTLIDINGKSFWEMKYNYLGEASLLASTGSDETTDETADDVQTDDTSDTQSEIREDGLVVIGEGRMYFALNDGIAYNIHVMCKEHPISAYPELESIINSIQLGRRQSDLMKIMWIIIGVLCVLCLAMIVVVIMAKTPKQIAKMNEAKALLEDFDEEEQLRNNEFVNEKIQMIAAAHALEAPQEDDDELVIAEIAGEEDITVDDIDVDDVFSEIEFDDIENMEAVEGVMTEHVIEDVAPEVYAEMTDEVEIIEDDIDFDAYFDSALTETSSFTLTFDDIEADE